MDNLEVKRIRESLGLTQQQLAKSCGVSVRSVQNWEAGSVAIPDSKRLLLQFGGLGFGNRTTAIYIDFDLRKVDAENRRVMDWLLYGRR